MPGIDAKPNWYYIRVKNPVGYDTCTWKTVSDGVAFIYCKKKGSDQWEIQAWRLSRDKFKSVADARDWLSKHKIDYMKGEFNSSVALYSLMSDQMSDETVVQGAKLSYGTRENLPDSAFCYVSGKDRKFPAHDAAHVRNGLARLSQSDLTPAEKAQVLACLKRRAKKYGINVAGEVPGVIGEAKAMPNFDLKEDVPTDVRDEDLFWVLPTKVGGAAFTALNEDPTKNGRIVYFTKDSLLDCSESWMGGKVYLNHDQSKVIGSIAKVVFADPYVYHGLALTPEAKKLNLAGSSVDLETAITDEENGIVAFAGDGVSLLEEGHTPACNIMDKKCDCGTVIGEKMEPDKKVETVSPPAEPPKTDAPKVESTAVQASVPPVEPAVDKKPNPDTPPAAVVVNVATPVQASVPPPAEPCSDCDKKIADLEKALAELKGQLGGYQEKERVQAEVQRKEVLDALKGIGLDPTKYEKLETAVIGQVVADFKAKNVGSVQGGAIDTKLNDKKEDYDYAKMKEAERKRLGLI